MSIKRSYMICTNPRSGSWLLSEALNEVKIAGHPREWFDDVERAKYAEKLGVPVSAPYELYINRVLALGTTPNGIWGAKCMRYQFEALPKKLNSIVDVDNQSIAESLERMFPNLRYIWLQRRDKIRQAISYYRADATQEWWALHVSNPNEPEGVIPDVPYNASSIAYHEKIVIENEEGWRRFFEESGRKPLIVYYEDFVENYEATIREVLAYLDIENHASVQIVAPRLKKQAGPQTDEWAERYVSEKRNGPIAAIPPIRKSVETANPLTDSWKRWIGENKLFGGTDESIRKILSEHKIDENAVNAEFIKLEKDPYFQAASLHADLMLKNRSYGMISRSLAKLDVNYGNIERRSGVSQAEFLEKYYAANRPVILCDLMKNWKALKRWNPKYFKDTCGDVMVEIMANRNDSQNYETDDTKHRKTVSFGAFADMIAREEKTNDYYLTARNEFFKIPGIKPLVKDIEIFPEYLDGTTNWMFLWYGPAGTVTPLHHDQMNIFMAQVQGRKRIRLIPSDEMDLVYNHEGVYSHIDIENPDYGRFPKFRDVTMIDVELAPSEVLFIPVGWWHHVRSLDTSITVTFMNFKFNNRFDWVHPITRS